MWKIIKKIYSKIPKRLKNKKVLAAIIIVLIGYTVLTRGSSDTSKIKTETVQRKSITSQVSASGVIKSEKQIDLKFSAAEKVIWIGVKEGDYVQKGTAIASINKESLEATLRQAQQDVVAADAELQKTYDSLNDDDTVESYADKVTRTAAEAKKNKAYDNMIIAQKNLRDATIYAPFSGTITSLDITVGQEVLSTTVVGQIADLTDLNFVAEADETDISNIESNQDVQVTLDAFDEPFDSKVFKIANTSSTTSTGSTAFEVTVKLPEENNFRIGMNGEALITTNSVDTTPTIPIDALVDNNSVYTKENSTYKKVQIETGIESDFDVQVTKGLNQGETIVTSGFAEIDKKSLLDRILRR